MGIERRRIVIVLKYCERFSHQCAKIIACLLCQQPCQFDNSFKSLFSCNMKSLCIMCIAITDFAGKAMNVFVLIIDSF